MVLLFIAIIWLLTFYVGQVLRKELEIQVGQQQISGTELLAGQIGEAITQKRMVMTSLGKVLGKHSFQDTGKLQEELDTRPFLKYLFNGGMAVLGRDGEVLANNPQGSIPASETLHLPELLAEARQHDGVLISRLVRGAEGVGPSVYIMGPVLDRTGQMAGAVTGRIDLGAPNFLGQITDARYGVSGGHIVVSRKHRMIVSATDRKRIMEPSPAPGRFPLIDHFLEGHEGSGVFVNPLGVEVLQSVKSVPGTDWYIGTQLPTSEAFSAINKLQQNMLLAALILSVLSGLLVRWVVKRQLGPLTEATEQLVLFQHSGAAPKMLKAGRSDEVGRLIEAFNQMMVGLRRRELLLQDSEQRVRLATEATGVGIWEWHLASNRVRWDKQMFRIYGMTPTEDGFIDYKAWSDCVFPEELPQQEQQMRDTIQTAGRGTREFRARRIDDGRERVIFAVDTVRTGDEGNVEWVVGTNLDITERKEAEVSRTVLEAQLRESQKMEAIGTLAGGIAHDFNNALATILGNVALARQDAVNHPNIQESLGEISKAGTRARDLVQQILSFSRRQPVQYKAIDLVPVVIEATRLLRSTLPQRIALEVHCAPDVPPVMADASQIEQMLINLATNAMQSIEGNGQITICLEAITLDPAALNTMRVFPLGGSGRVLRLTVSDNGAGMSASVKERIFEPFFTTKPLGTGTGLGLSVVHGIVQGHGGLITVESREGAGTTFYIDLPVAESEHEAKAQDSGRSGSVPQAELRGRRVLYLDDDETLTFLIQRTLERKGYQVSTFMDQGRALQCLRENPLAFDLILTDYNMPGMSGLEVVREVRAINPDLPVAIASGFIDESLTAKARDAGVSELIFKADDIEVFCDSVRRLLQ